MTDNVVIISAALSAGAVGYLGALLRELAKCRTDLSARVKEFDEMTKIASQANLSMAEKLLQLEERLANLEFKLTASSASTSHWKK